MKSDMYNRRTFMTKNTLYKAVHAENHREIDIILSAPHKGLHPTESKQRQRDEY